jgi:D-3-phosphoglycerate dehydrogenase
MLPSTPVRVCVLHRNVPAVISSITTALSSEGLNIENLMNKSKGDNAYTVLDVCGDVSVEAEKKLSEIANVYAVRVIK